MLECKYNLERLHIRDEDKEAYDEKVKEIENSKVINILKTQPGVEEYIDIEEVRELKKEVEKLKEEKKQVKKKTSK